MKSDIQIIKVPAKVYWKKNHSSSYPCLELRKNFQDYDTITKIIDSIYNEKPLLILPTFTDKIKALDKLVDMGIIERRIDSDNNICFNLVKF